MTFDARAAKLLQQGQHLTIDGCPGLRLEAGKDARTWIYRYKSPTDGRMKQKKLGRWPAMSYASALGEWEKARTEREAGVDVAAEKRVARAAELAALDAKKAREAGQAYTVRKLCDDYLVYIDRVRKKKGAKEIRRIFDTMLGDLANMPAVAVTRTVAFDLLEQHAGTPVLAGQLRGELGGAWEHALDAGRLPDSCPNWWRQVKRGRLKSKGRKIQGRHIGTAKRVLRPDEVATLIPWLPNFSRPVCDVLTLYLWTAARGAEIVSMEAEEITEERDGLWWTLPKSKTKNARIESATDFRVPLVGRAAEIVRRRLQAYKRGYLFPARKKPWDTEPKHMEQKVAGVAVHYHMPYSGTRPEQERPRLPVVRWAPHDLRRTARTMLASMGCPREVGEVIVGHVLPGVEGVYNLHTYDDERRQWLTALSERLEVLASGTAPPAADPA